jgi:hypothetical protein
MPYGKKYCGHMPFWQGLEAMRKYFMPYGKKYCGSNEQELYAIWQEGLRAHAFSTGIKYEATVLHT